MLLDFPLPLALYKKVARQPLTLRDLEGFDPTLGRSLRQLLDYNGGILSLRRVYQFSRSGMLWDLEGFDPTLGSSLHQLLDFNGGD